MEKYTNFYCLINTIIETKHTKIPEIKFPYHLIKTLKIVCSKEVSVNVYIRSFHPLSKFRSQNLFFSKSADISYHLELSNCPRDILFVHNKKAYFRVNKLFQQFKINTYFSYFFVLSRVGLELLFAHTHISVRPEEWIVKKFLVFLLEIDDTYCIVQTASLAAVRTPLFINN